MSRNTLLGLGIAALTFATLVGCQKEPAPAGTPSAAAESGVPKALEPVKDDLPAGDNPTDVQTPEDFEEEAAKAIDEKNVKAQVDALEKELDADQ